MISYVYKMSSWCSSLFNLQWVPGSRSKLIELDKNLRSSILHKNHGKWVTVSHEGRQHDIWTVVVEGDDRTTVPIVLVHGMGGGSNMFLKNVDCYAKQRDVILIDLPGFGLSSRPDLNAKQDKNGTDTEIDVEEFYTQVLEKWFNIMNLDNIILLGHSFGGYLSSVYCLSHPDRVKHLILADPWGFCRPRSVTASTIKWKIILFLVGKLYYKVNVFTPFRWLGPLGPRAFRSFRSDLNERYKVGEEEEDTTFIDYLFACNTAGDPSGEIGFAKVSQPPAFARKPMVDRAQDWAPSLDVTFVCGKDSWMDSSYGKEIEKLRPDSYTHLQVVENAGHHVQADNAPLFNHIVQQVTKAVDTNTRPVVLQ